MQCIMTKKIKVLKDFTYYSLIKEAIYSTENMQATSSEIFTYFVIKYPDLFRPSNAMTWKGNIRQVLSKNPEFVKLKKHGNNKEHYWTHRPAEEILERENRLFEQHKILNRILREDLDVGRFPNLLKAQLAKCECLCRNHQMRNEIERDIFENKENTSNIGCYPIEELEAHCDENTSNENSKNQTIDGFNSNTSAYKEHNKPGCNGEMYIKAHIGTDALLEGLGSKEEPEKDQ